MTIKVKGIELAPAEALYKKEFDDAEKILLANPEKILDVICDFVDKIEPSENIQDLDKTIQRAGVEILQLPPFITLTHSLRDGKPGISIKHIIQIQAFVLQELPTLNPPEKPADIWDQKFPGNILITDFGRFLNLNHIIGKGACKTASRYVRVDDKKYPFAVEVAPFCPKEAATLKELAGLPGIVKIHGILESRIRTRVFMEEYPFTMADIIHRGDLADHKKVQYLIHIAEGLKTLHQKGFIHRDLKPANILAREDGTAVLNDFGVTIREEELDERTRTTGHYPLWSPEYYASIGNLEARIAATRPSLDMWAFGCISYVFLNEFQREPFWFQPEQQKIQFTISSLKEEDKAAWLPRAEFNPLVYPFLDEVLVLDPRKRSTADASLNTLRYYREILAQPQEPQAAAPASSSCVIS